MNNIKIAIYDVDAMRDTDGLVVIGNRDALLALARHIEKVADGEIGVRNDFDVGFPDNGYDQIGFEKTEEWNTDGSPKSFVEKKHTRWDLIKGCLSLIALGVLGFVVIFSLVAAFVYVKKIMFGV